jgi:hypothetical protein
MRSIDVPGNTADHFFCNFIGLDYDRKGPEASLTAIDLTMPKPK